MKKKLHLKAEVSTHHGAVQFFNVTDGLPA